MSVPTYTLDGDPVDLEEFFLDNMVPGEEAFSPDEMEEIRSMRPGQAFVTGGGAVAEFVLRRES